MQRIAFSPVVREAGDLAIALFDRRGRMVAQANTGTPGHINSLAAAGGHLVAASPIGLRRETCSSPTTRGSPRDISSTSRSSPDVRCDRVIAYIGSTIHHTDIGGYGIGAGARDVHEEGLGFRRSSFTARASRARSCTR